MTSTQAIRKAIEANDHVALKAELNELKGARAAYIILDQLADGFGKTDDKLENLLQMFARQ